MEEFNIKILDTCKIISGEKYELCTKEGFLDSIYAQLTTRKTIDDIIKNFKDGYTMKELPGDGKSICTIKSFKDAINAQLLSIKAKGLGHTVTSTDEEINAALSKL